MPLIRQCPLPLLSFFIEVKRIQSVLAQVVVVRVVQKLVLVNRLLLILALQIIRIKVEVQRIRITFPEMFSRSRVEIVIINKVANVPFLKIRYLKYYTHN